MLVDCHCHLFPAHVVENCVRKPDLVREIRLDVEGAPSRKGADTLQASAEDNNIETCILMPTALPAAVQRENDRHLGAAAAFVRLQSCATLYPEMKNLEEEISRVIHLGAAGFKFSTFSQRFDLTSAYSMAMFEKIENSATGDWNPVVVLDTFTKSDIHFGAAAEHVTTPLKLSTLAARFERIRFVGAHMGGLAADFDHLLRYLPPAPNLYLDTSNAAHTLSEDDFLELVNMHGPSKIMFGTDWPWFSHESELVLLKRILKRLKGDPDAWERVSGLTARSVFNLI